MPDSLLIEQIGAVAWSEQRKIVVLDRAGRRVILLDASGRVSRVFGRRGSAPGEFQLPSRVGFTHDTLWITDPGLSRITFLPGSGALYTVSWSHPSPGPGLSAVFARAVLHDGRVLGNPSALKVEIGESTVVPYFIATRPRAATLDTVFTTTMRSASVVVAVPNGSMTIGNPFNSPEYVTSSTNGQWLVRLREYQTGSDGRDLELRDLVNGAVRTLRVRCTPGLLSSAERARILDGLVNTAPGPLSVPASVRQTVLAKFASVPATRVCVHDIMVGGDGTVAMRMESQAKVLQWRILRPDGSAPVQLMLPATSRIYDALGGELLIVEVDGDGLPSLLIRSIPTP